MHACQGKIYMKGGNHVTKIDVGQHRFVAKNVKFPVLNPYNHNNHL